MEIVILNGGPRSTLIINEVQKHHFGDYGCTVRNDMGTSDSSITLVEKGEPGQIVNCKLNFYNVLILI